MGLLDSVTGAVGKLADVGGIGGGVSDILSKAGIDAMKGIMSDPLGTLMNPSSIGSKLLDSTLKQMGIPAELRNIATFVADPQTKLKEMALGMLQQGPGLIGANGKTDNSMKIFDNACVQTPGGISIAIKGEGQANISISMDSGPASVKLGGNGRAEFNVGQDGPASVKLGGNGKAEINITGFDPTKDTSFTLPDGTKISIKVEPHPTEPGGKRCGCDLPDGSKVIWDVIKNAGKDALGLAGIFGKLAGGGIGGVLMGPFGGALAGLVKGGLGALQDGQVATPGTGGGIGANIGANFGVDLAFNVNRGAGGTGGAGGAGGANRTAGLSEGDQAMVAGLNRLGGEVEELKKKMADPNLKPEERMALQFELQQKMQELTQLQSMLTNLLKSVHDARQEVNRNIKA